jgi:hypothetical protein
MSEWSKELASKASSPARGSWVRIPLSPPSCFNAFCAQELNWVLCDENSRTVSGPDGSSTKGDLSGDIGAPGLVLGQKARFLFKLDFVMTSFVAFVRTCRIDRCFVVEQDYDFHHRN